MQDQLLTCSSCNGGGRSVGWGCMCDFGSREDDARGRTGWARCYSSFVLPRGEVRKMAIGVCFINQWGQGGRNAIAALSCPGVKPEKMAIGVCFINQWGHVACEQ
jgi:hypothetical protein